MSASSSTRHTSGEQPEPPKEETPEEEEGDKSPAAEKPEELTATDRMFQEREEKQPIEAIPPFTGSPVGSKTGEVAGENPVPGSLKEEIASAAGSEFKSAIPPTPDTPESTGCFGFGSSSKSR